MNDETFERISEFVKRNAVPPTQYFPHGLPVPLYVSDEVEDDDPQFSEPPHAMGIRISPADKADLRKRLDASGLEYVPNAPTSST